MEEEIKSGALDIKEGLTDDEDIIDLTDIADLPLDENGDIFDFTDSVDDFSEKKEAVQESDIDFGESSLQEEMMPALDKIFSESPLKDEGSSDELLTEEKIPELFGDTPEPSTNKEETFEFDNLDAELFSEDKTIRTPDDIFDKTTEPHEAIDEPPADDETELLSDLAEKEGPLEEKESFPEPDVEFLDDEHIEELAEEVELVDVASLYFDEKPDSDLNKEHDFTGSPVTDSGTEEKDELVDVDSLYSDEKLDFALNKENDFAGFPETGLGAETDLFGDPGAEELPDESVPADSKGEDDADSDSLFATEPQEKSFKIDSETISPEMIEAAVEEVIKKMFSQKIENMFADVIERKITEEIDRVKSILRGHASDDA